MWVKVRKNTGNLPRVRIVEPSMASGHASTHDGVGGGCLDDERLALLLDGSLAPDEEAVMRAHLDSCEPCRMLFADAARGGESSPGSGTDSGIHGARAITRRAPATSGTACGGGADVGAGTGGASLRRV